MARRWQSQVDLPEHVLIQHEAIVSLGDSPDLRTHRLGDIRGFYEIVDATRQVVRAPGEPPGSKSLDSTSSTLVVVICRATSLC